MSHSKSSRQCWYPSAGGVLVDVDPDLVAHVSQVHRCGSPHVCPSCAPVIRHRRAVEVDQAVAAAMEAGGTVLFLTLTVRHSRRDELKPRLDLCASALGRLFRGAPWQRQAARLGYFGAIRAVEVIRTDSGGWHPHTHSLLFFDRVLSPAEVASLRAWLLARWEGVVVRAGFGTLHQVHGVDLRPVTSEGVGQYLSKVEGGWSAGSELARSGAKRGAAGKVTPFELLAQAAAGDRRALALWLEYEDATFGTKALRWSPGLRARLVGAPELSDAQLAAEPASESVYSELVAAAEWVAALRSGEVAWLLEEVEARAALHLLRMRSREEVQRCPDAIPPGPAVVAPVPRSGP